MPQSWWRALTKRDKRIEASETKSHQAYAKGKHIIKLNVLKKCEMEGNPLRYAGERKTVERSIHTCLQRKTKKEWT